MLSTSSAKLDPHAERPPQHGEVYQPLGVDEFRVLRLEPGGYEQALRGRFEIIPLAQCPQYRAISYYWGQQPVFSERLLLPSGRLGTTVSLDGAFRRLRKRCMWTRLWADAVCINQRHDEERSYQVNRMADIYRNASEVFVWLGEAQPSDKIAFWTIDFLVWFSKRLKCQLDDYHNFEDPPEEVNIRLRWYFNYRRTRWQRLRDTCCPSTPISWDFTINDAFECLGRLLQRPWFSRQWVVQEAALAKSCTMHCGAHRTSMADLLIAARYGYALNINCFDPKARLAKAIDLGLWARSNDFLYNLIDAWRVGRCSSHKQQFLDAVIEGSNSLGARDPRDRIWALRAMPFAQREARLEADYTRVDLNELYRRFAVSILTTPDDGNMSPAVIFALAGKEKRPAGTALPSWVANMHTGDIRTHYTYYGNGTYNKCAGGKPRVMKVMHSEDEPFVLLVQGAILGTITSILVESRLPHCLQSIRPGRQRIPDAGSSIIPWYLRCREFALTNGPEAHTERMSLACSFDTFMLQDQHTDRSDLQALDLHIEQLLNKAVDEQNTDTEGLQIPLDTDMIRRDLFFFLQGCSVKETVDPRKLVAATSNGLVGWVPDNAETGDCVVLFTGAPSPFVVRSGGGGCYAVIGDAYMHGIAYGEAWPPDESLMKTLRLV